MSKKKNSIFSILLLVILASVCYLSITQVKTNVEVNEEQNDLSDNVLSSPKTSVATKLWNYTSDLAAYSSAVSADGQYLAVGTMYDVSYPSKTTKIYYFNTSNNGNRPMWSYDTGNYGIFKIAISKNGSYFIAAGGDDDGNTKAFFLNSTKPASGVAKQEMWNVTLDSISSVDISANGKYIALSYGDGFYLYNYSYNSTGGRDKTKEYEWYYFSSPSVTSVAISDNGNYVVGGTNYNGLDDVIYFFNNSIRYFGELHNPIWTYHYDIGVDNNINCVAISEDGYYVAACSDVGIAFLFNNTKTTPKQEVWYFNLSEITGFTFTFNSVDISKDGNYIALGGYFSMIPNDYLHIGCVVLFDNKYNTTGGGRDKLNDILWAYFTNGSVSSVSISADGSYIAAGTTYNHETGDDLSLDENTVFLFKNPGYKISSSTGLPGINPPIFAFNTSYNVREMSISDSGIYFAAAGDYGSGLGNTYLFYNDITIPSSAIPPSGGDDDDDDDDEPAAIPFGSYYLLFALLAVVSLILINKRKAILSKS